MSILTNRNLPDVQQNKFIPYARKIDKVGVGGVEVFLPIQMKNGSVQTPVAVISTYCGLSSDVAGINMSRGAQVIFETLRATSTGNGYSDMKRFCRELVEKHKSPDVWCKARFKLILNDVAPMSGHPTNEPVECIIETKYKSGAYRNFLTVDYVGMSMCPCAKELASLWTNTTEEEHKIIDAIENEELKWKIKNAGYSSHSQKSRFRVTVELDDTNLLWIEDLVQMMKESFSTPTTMLAKRCDEAYTVETAYLGGYFDDDKKFNKVENTGPKFVEDEIRCLAKFLDKELDKRIKDYVIVCTNYESLHSRDETAVAVLNAGRDLD